MQMYSKLWKHAIIVFVGVKRVLELERLEVALLADSEYKDVLKTGVLETKLEVWMTSNFVFGVPGGTRTHDIQNHNLTL